MKKPLLKEVLPELSNQIKEMFNKRKRFDLSLQVDDLNIYGICPCRNIECGSFFVMEPPNDNNDLKDIEMEGFVLVKGSVLIEVYKGTIGFIEIIPSKYGSEIRLKIMNELEKDF